MIRVFLTIVAILAFAIAPAYAQTGQGSDKNRERNAKQDKAATEAYQSALQRIPDSSDKYDPWAIARPSPPQGKLGKTK